MFRLNGVMAHRGDQTEAAENTMQAFQDAIVHSGADWIELDVYTTKDGQLVVHHDDTSARVGDASLAMNTSTYDELRRVDVGCEFRKLRGLTKEQFPQCEMPLLRDVIELVRSQTVRPYIRVSIQPKDESAAAAVKMVQDMNAVEFCGFNDGSLKKMSLVKSLEPRLVIFWDRSAKPDIAKDIKAIQKHGFENVVINYKGVTKEMVQQYRTAVPGLRVGAWTVNDEATWRTMLDCGVDLMYTDRPRDLLAYKAQYDRDNSQSQTQGYCGVA